MFLVVSLAVAGSSVFPPLIQKRVFRVSPPSTVQPLAKKENFDYDKFYRAYANLWLIKTNLMVAQALVEDVHPMNYLRINCTLQQFDEFLDQ